MSEAAQAEKPAAPAMPALKAILGQKIGMTQIFDGQGRIIPVTVVQAGPCPIMQVLTTEKHGYLGLQVAFGDVREKSVNKPAQGYFKKANTAPAKWVREFRTDKAPSFQVGQALKVDAFTAGDFVDVIGTSKGKGFAGAVKRHNFAGGPSTHGQSDRQRAPGASGSNTYPGRVFKGKRFPGHLGAERVTVQHLEVVQVLPEKDLLMVRGAVPGPNQSLIVIQETIKRSKHRVAHHAEPGKKAKK
jgi:large subunit ribosomal protein L3